MISTPLLSVILPVYNQGSYLKEAIESVLNQSYSPIELIVIDDGSTDESATSIKSHKDVRYAYQENAGPAAARNLGISMAKGEYIGFHDADDVCDLNRFKLQMQELLDDTKIKIIFSQIKNFVQVGTIVPPYMQTPELMKPRLGFVSSAVVHKSVFNKIGLFNPDLRIGEDVEWIIRAHENQICSCTYADVLVKRRLHDNNISKDISTGHKNLAQILLSAIKRREG